jgi:hypothetical protein
MIRNCWMKSSEELGELKSLFANADNNVSLYYADNPSIREEHIESRLVTTLEQQPSGVYQARINEDRLRRGLPTLAIDIKHITHSERRNGADMGLVASLNIPGEMLLTKALLAQSKKLYRGVNGFSQTSSYDEIFGGDSASPQWDRLLNVTSSSVYLLFGPDRLRIRNKMRSFGTQVLSAQSIKGLAESGVSRVTAAMAYSRGLDFPSWIVNEFICCNVGDSTTGVIDIARGKNSNFTVRNTIEVSIRGRNFTPDLFQAVGT